MAEGLESKKGKAPVTSSLTRRHLRKFWEAGGVGEFIQQKLEGRSTTSSIATPISQAVYLEFLPTIWAFIAKFASSDSGPNLILKAALKHAVTTTSKSASKKGTIEFVSRLALVGLLKAFLEFGLTGAA